MTVEKTAAVSNNTSLAVLRSAIQVSNHKTPRDPLSICCVKLWILSDRHQSWCCAHDGCPDLRTHLRMFE